MIGCKKKKNPQPKSALVLQKHDPSIHKSSQNIEEYE